MHYIGKEMKVVAESPDGRPIPLIWIKDWDFNWQGQYQYKEPVNLPKGTVIKLDAFYDNSADNPRNPSKPPKRVHWGEQTTDEMCLCGIKVVTDTPADLKKIRMMNFADIGAIMGGGLTAGRAGPAGGAFRAAIDAETRKKILAKLPADGFPFRKLFTAARAVRSNHDGRLTAAEVEAMPEPSRSRMVDAIPKKIEANEKANEKR